MAKTVRSRKAATSSGTKARGKDSAAARKPSAGTRKKTAARVSSFAYQTTDSVFKVASEGAAGIADRVHGLLDEQVGRGAAMMSQVANSTRLAAEDMSGTMPHAANLVGTMADRLDAFAGDVQDKTVDQIVGIAADFTRRQPLVTFGIAAFAGFLAMRALTNSGTQAAPVRTAARKPAARKRSAGNG